MFVIELDLSENVIEMDLCAVDLLDRIENTGRTASRSKDPSINQASKQDDTTTTRDTTVNRNNNARKQIVSQHENTHTVCINTYTSKERNKQTNNNKELSSHHVTVYDIRAFEKDGAL